MEYTDLFKDKTYNGNLNIEKEKVSVDTNHTFDMIEIHYAGKMNIQTLLPSGCTLEHDRLSHKIIIHKNRKANISDLFKYRGKASIKKSFLLLGNNKTNLYVNKSNLELWNTLRKTEKVGETDGVEQDWAYLTKNWEDISFDGNNAKQPYIYRKTTYDKEANTYTTIKEIRKK
tara:strand:+ start:3502 stop:4020 length:519 start_codon:yes stop_codon:yes gene_type:complete